MWDRDGGGDCVLFIHDSCNFQAASLSKAWLFVGRYCHIGVLLMSAEL